MPAFNLLSKRLGNLITIYIPTSVFYGFLGTPNLGVSTVYFRCFFCTWQRWMLHFKISRVSRNV